MTGVALGFDNPTGVNCRHGFLWLARELSLNARSGQVGTLVRTASSTAVDDSGTSGTVFHSQPAWERVDTDADAVRDRMALKLGADLLSWPFQPTPAAMSGIVEFIERGTVGVVSDGLFYLGNDGVTGARLYIDSTGTFYRLTYHDGTNPAVTSTLAVAPSTGDLVRLHWTIGGGGIVQLSQSIAGGAWVTAAASSGLALASTWGAGAAKVRLNSKGTGNDGTMAALGVILDLGVARRTEHLQTLATG
jgi:hypothetical protein